MMLDIQNICGVVTRTAAVGFHMAALIDLALEVVHKRV